MDASLSAAAWSVWAKTSDDGVGMSLIRHLEDTAALADHVWSQWLARVVRRRISEGLPGGDADGLLALRWMAGMHDVGKATPAFAIQAEARSPHLVEAMRRAGLDMPADVTDRRLLRHELASAHVLRAWLTERPGWSKATATGWAVVVGGHHGAPPAARDLQRPPKYPHLLGTGRWSEVQRELVEHVTDLVGVRGRLAEWSTHPLSPGAQVLLTAAVIICDWLASNPEFFPPVDVVAMSSRERAVRAWKDVDLPPPWVAQRPPATPDLFRSRFALPDGASLRPVQQLVVEVASRAESTGLVIIEAPMGEGKTEAALAAAEVLAHRTGAGGVFVALPTMATSDAMFRRVLDWVRRLPVTGEDTDLTMYLAHGKAALNRDAQQLWRTGASGIAVDEADVASTGEGRTLHAEAVAHAWLRGRKRGVLSSFVVGTIDQVLFAALRSKHLVLRHLALAGKVVVIDEVHAADAHMRVFLERALEWLGGYGTPVVLLSATLPAVQRRALVEAYDRGRAGAAGLLQQQDHHVLDGDPGYPVVTSSTLGTPAVDVAPGSGRGHRVLVEGLADDDDALVAVLQAALVDGGCAAVVRNTVRRAQDTYRMLTERLGCEVLLLHSRFVAVDRAQRERELRDRLGPPDAVAASGASRPHRLVVVGTQVLEQSLDIDLDLMVTDVAPVDLVLQRLGRLHRHPRGVGQRERPPLLRDARCWLTGVDWSTTPPRPVPGSVAVYEQAPLLRALAVLQPHLESSHLDLPDDISPLVQQAYADSFDAPRGWEEAVAVAEERYRLATAQRQEAAGIFCLGGVRAPTKNLVDWLRGTAGEVDDDSPAGQGHVRDGEDTLEVLVVQRIDGAVRVLPWVGQQGGREIATSGPPDDDIARAVAGCTLKLPLQLGRGRGLDALIEALERRGHASWQQSTWLAGQLVLELDHDLAAELPGHRVKYERSEGLSIVASVGEG